MPKGIYVLTGKLALDASNSQAKGKTTTTAAHEPATHAQAGAGKNQPAAAQNNGGQKSSTTAAKPDVAANTGPVTSQHKVPFVLKENRAPKIFGNREGHLPDTPENRNLLLNVANDSSTTLGKDKLGNTWSAKTFPDGSQVWVQTRGGQIWNGGLNNPPKSFNPTTGLSSPTRPGWK
ncbi:MAG: hypothetical protein Q4A28_06935 [Brachymonas sp.]|nr:hypothetical protein [Brachymonas sp.]